MCFTAMHDIADCTTGIAEFRAMPRQLFSNLPQTPSVEKHISTLQ